MSDTDKREWGIRNRHTGFWLMATCGTVMEYRTKEAAEAQLENDRLINLEMGYAAHIDNWYVAQFGTEFRPYPLLEKSVEVNA